MSCDIEPQSENEIVQNLNLQAVVPPDDTPEETYFEFYFPFESPYLEPLPPLANADWIYGDESGTLAVGFTCDQVVNGKVAYSFEFSGASSSDYLENDWAVVAPHPSFNIDTSGVYIGFWINTTSQKNNNTVLDNRSNSGGYHVTIYKGRPMIQLSSESVGYANYGPTTGPVVNDGEWHYVEFCIYRTSEDDPSPFLSIIYVDDNPIHTFNNDKFNGKSLSSTESLWIGRHLFNPSYNFQGKLDELTIKYFTYIPL